MANAAVLEKNVMMIIGAEDHEGCEEIVPRVTRSNMFYDGANKDVRSAVGHYCLVGIDPERTPEELMKLPERDRMFLEQFAPKEGENRTMMLAVMSSTGRPLGQIRWDELATDEGRLATEKLVAFLNGHKPSYKNPEIELKRGLVEAALGQKKVLLYELPDDPDLARITLRWFDENAEIWKKSFAIVSLHPRMPGGGKVIGPYRPNQWDITWMAILNSAGEKLAETSVAGVSVFPQVEERVTYAIPVSREEKEHFRGLLETYAPELTEAEREKLVGWQPE